MLSRKQISGLTSETKQRQNNLLYESLAYNGNIIGQTEITFTVYDSINFKSEEIKTDEISMIKPEKDRINWIHVSGLSDTRSVGELCMRLGIPIPIVQDILNARHISKIEETGGMLFAVIDAYAYSDKLNLEREHQSFLLYSNIIISFEEGRKAIYGQIRKALHDGTGQARKLKPDFLFNLLINMVVDSYFDVIEIMQNNLMDLEDLLMEFTAVHKETGQQIQHFRRDLSRLKKNVFPFHEQFGHLLIMEPEQMNDSTRLYFRDTYDHLRQVSMMLEANREIIASLVDLYMANNDLRMNQIMKQLTVVSTIFIPLTFLVGVWGMNFANMPELSWKYGYLIAWIVMVIIGIVLYLWFRRRNLLK